MSFAGASYVALPSWFSPSSWSGLTIEAWVNVSTLTTGNPRLVANSHTDADHKGIQLAFNGTAGPGAPGIVDFALGNGSSMQQITSASALTTGIWTYIAATWDGSTMALYVNGDPQASGAFSGPISNALYPINLGRNPAYNGDYLTGELSLISFYNRALPAASIARRYQNATAISTTLYGGGYPTLPGQPLPPYSGIYGGQYGYSL
jgi:hypothetical protein